MSSGRISLTDSIHRKVHRAAGHAQNFHRGNVTSVDPLQVRMWNFSIPLTVDEDFTVGAWARWYAQKIGFAVGDMVLMHRDVTDWVLVELVSDATGAQMAQAMPTEPSGDVGFSAGPLSPQSASLVAHPTRQEVATEEEHHGVSHEEFEEFREAIHDRFEHLYDSLQELEERVAALEQRPAPTPGPGPATRAKITISAG